VAAKGKYIQIGGLDHVNALLKRASGPQGKAAIRKALRKAFKPMLASARSLAPAKTGALKKAIKIKAIRTRKGIALKVSVGGKDYVGDEFYGAFQEFGWKAGPRDSEHDRPEVEGKHFLEKAYDRHGEQAKKDTVDGIVDGLEALLGGK
jgi:HK97 gp10 family phage protein